jgi:hypothetical protein
MGYWANTTYIHHGSVEAVADALARLCESEGMTRVPVPPQRQRLLVEPMQYDEALHNDLWGVAIFPGAPSWTVIQMARRISSAIFLVRFLGRVSGSSDTQVS